MSQHRFAEVDALRAFAVTLVVWIHTTGEEISVGTYRLGGYHGVLLFFVISGFLITGILLDARAAAARHTATRGSVLRSFYIRRFLRIFPIYYAVLVLTFVINIPAVRAEVGWHVTYLSNWYFAFRGTFGDTTAHLWSLAVEEQFYLVWPWFVLLAPTATLRWCIAAMIIIGPVSRLVLGSAGVNHLAVWITTPTVLDALGLGCLLAYVWRKTTSADRVANWMGLSGVVAVGLDTTMKLLGTPEYVVFAISPLGWGLVCTWVVHRAARTVRGRIGTMLRARPLVYLGTISYGVYLFHPFVMSILAKIQHRLGFDVTTHLDEGGRRKFVAVMLMSLAAAAVSWRFFERPINSLKNHFPYARDPRLATGDIQIPVP